MQTATSIIPAIIPESLAHLAQEAARVAACAPTIQIDIIDGIFAGTAHWPFSGDFAELARIETALPQRMRYELDLMVLDSEECMRMLGACAPSRIILHLASFKGDVARGLKAITQAYAHAPEVYCAIDNNTSVEALAPYLSEIDGVQCMGIAQVGAQGNTFDERVLAHIEALRRQYPELPISIDGSVNANTLASLRAAGAIRFAVGSAIFGATDPCVAVLTLAAMIEKKSSTE